ncbi:hypothetical protein FJ364_02315 [Candidatus Dependentiae bacterium]|nr:hypothetical protein [Candidatus Dependentiae bacterium]
MKNTMKRVLALSLVVLQGMAFADTNNRLFYTARPHLSNMPLKLGTFYSAANQDNPGFGGAFQAAAFYEQSTDQNKAGKFFSFTNKNSFKIQGAAAAAGLNAAAADADALPGNFALDRGYNGNITLRPQRTSYGLHLNYQQDLHNIIENLYMVAAAPVVTVEHTLGVKEEITANPGYTFAHVMAGGRLTSDFSAPVEYGKIVNKQRVTGLADVDLGLGYRIFNNDRVRVQGEIHGVIPTGQNPSGRHMFEALVGNNGHWGLGANLSGRVNVWQNQENEDNRFSLWVNADVKYLFENNQVRTLGLKDKPGAQFARMRQQNPATPANVLANSVPGLNAMTRAVKVNPGVQAEGMLWGDYTMNAWKFGLGYNIFGRQAESVKLKGALADGGTYGLTAQLVEVTNAPATEANYLNQTNATNAVGNLTLAAAGNAIRQNDHFIFPTQISAGPAAYAANQPMGAVASISDIKTNAANNGTFIADADLDMLVQKAAISHKVAGQVSYALNTDNPSYLGLGGGYEFAGSNDLLSNWQVWAKFGITF